MDKYLLTPSEIKEISLTENDASEIESMATIGLEPDEHIEYKQRITWLCDEKLKKLTAEAQLAKAIPLIREEVRKETAEEILEYISDLKMIKYNQEDAERFECLRIKYGIEGK
jgi:hypothetical protein